MRKRRVNLNINFKLYIIVFLIIIFLIINIYVLNYKITPALLNAGEVEARAKITETINSVVLDEYCNKFNYDNIIKVEKDKDGNIAIIKADTLKMNKIACDVAIKSQQELKKIGDIGVEIPLGYVLQNNLLAFLGPNIKIKMQPVGYIETKYISDFEGVGINQTRHKIYVQVKTNMKIILPTNGSKIEVKNEVPISETIIVGKVPESAINLGLDKAGFKLPSEK